ncbi:FAD-binding oxidoreductase [Paracoccaceae bacterium]|nr:FAD-binding oxidoreductase [Paracoccaceae bacterium]
MNNLWEKTSREKESFSKNPESITADLLIVGGGFTGCSAALEAAKQGAKVVLLECETIGFGGSGRNVGLVNSGLWLPPKKIISILGEKQGETLISALGSAPNLVFSIIEENKIKCDPERNGTLHCAHSKRGMEYLSERFYQGEKFGEPLTLIDKAGTENKIGSSKFLGSLRDPRAGTIHPLAYCRGLARKAKEMGAKIYEKSKVNNIRKHNNIWYVSVKDIVVKSKYLLLAMNAYQDLNDEQNKGKFSTVYYSQFATRPLNSNEMSAILPGKEGCWDTATIMSSFRVDNAGRLILGTMGNSEGFGKFIHSNWANKKLRDLFPFLPDLEFDYRWTGKIAMTRDHIPKIVNFKENALSCFGYSGRGIAPGTLFGKTCASALLSENLSILPVHALKKYQEPFTREKTTFYEIAAVANNSIKSMKM